GSKGNSIQGISGNNTLIGGAGEDILNGGTGNNVYTGGAGKDTLIYSGGNDTITDYAAGQDVISLANGMSVSDFEYVNNNKNLVLKISNGTSIVGSVTVNNGVNKKIAIGSDLESADISVYGLKTLTATAGKDDDFVTVDATTVANKQVTTINASGLKATVGASLFANNNATTINGGAGVDNITGGAGNDLIKGNAGDDEIDGGTGNNTIYGGKGNDYLVGSAGRDNTSNVFSYANGDGKDVITKYGASDKITVTGGAVIGVNLSSDEKDVIFNIAANAKATAATGTITVKDAGTTAISVNGKTYKIGEGDLAPAASSERAAGFVEEIDDELLNSTNFITGADNSLDSIMNVGISNAVSTDELYSTTNDVTNISKVTASVYNKKSNNQ
ncbi:MAG: hypothetical protein IJ563_09460, partial [Selenomonadaceae bacterium]|nr:hypothetical protein [Selenomonadaceae bacterium]